MRRRYSDGFEPPAPVVETAVRAPSGLAEVVVEGKLDTGADVCAFPERLVAELELPPVRVVRAAGFAGALVEAIVYRIDLRIEETIFRRVEALVTRRPYAIIGRNVLARCVPPSGRTDAQLRPPLAGILSSGTAQRPRPTRPWTHPRTRATLAR